MQDLAGQPVLVIRNGAHDSLSRSRSTMRSRLVPIGRESFRCRVIGRPEIAAAAGPNVKVALRYGPSWPGKGRQPVVGHHSSRIRPFPALSAHWYRISFVLVTACRCIIVRSIVGRIFRA